MDHLNDLPIALRREARSTAGKPPVRYGFEDNYEDEHSSEESNYVSYESLPLPSEYQAFVTTLQSAHISKKTGKRQSKIQDGKRQCLKS